MSLTSGDVTQFLRDYGEYNILLDEVEFSPDDINKAMHFAVQRFNALTPTSTYTTDNFPNEWILLIGTCSHLMMSESFLQLRNQATYRDGDIENIGVDDKFALYQQLSANLANDWNTHAQKIKQQINMESAYGSLSSGYRWLRTGTRNTN
jgi:hypothetical protein